MQNLKPSKLDTVAESEALLEAMDIYATRHIFYMQDLKPSYLDTVAELKALLEASDIYATRRIFLYYWAGSRGG